MTAAGCGGCDMGCVCYLTPRWVVGVSAFSMRAWYRGQSLAILFISIEQCRGFRLN